jgi:DNA-binding transcriptional ArsR family regulator
LVFRALADPTRRHILRRIAQSDRTVAELAKPFAISAPAVSRHLKLLEDAGILERVRTGKYHRFWLNTDPLAEVRQILEKLTSFWVQRLDSLENFLDAEEEAKIKDKPMQRLKSRGSRKPSGWMEQLL